VPLSHVVETMRPLPVQPRAGMPPFVRGLSVIRGASIPVVDLGALLGLPAAAQPTRFVSLRAGERRIALAVEEVIGVRALASVSLETLPPLLQRARPRVIDLVGRLDASLLIVLQDSRFVPDWAWKSLAGEGDRLCPPV